MSLETEINRIAADEAVSIETNLAVVAKRRGELALLMAQKQADAPQKQEADAPKAPPADGTGTAIDKVA